MIRVVYLDNENVEQTVDLDLDIYDVNGLDQYFEDNLGYHPRSVTAKEI